MVKYDDIIVRAKTYYVIDDGYLGLVVKPIVVLEKAEGENKKKILTLINGMLKWLGTEEVYPTKTEATMELIKRI